MQGIFEQMNKVIQSFIHLALIFGLAACSSGKYKVERTQGVNLEITPSLAEAEAAEKLIEPYRLPLSASMAEVIVRSNAPALKGLPESSLGNLIADVLLNGATERLNSPVDLAFLNTGGLRVEWPQGEITRAMIFELMPFENRVEVVSITGSDVVGLLDQVAQRGGSPMAGIQFGIENNKAVNVLIQGQAIELDKVYQMVSTDYLLNDGDKYNMPKFIQRQPLKIKFRDLLLEDMGRMGKQAIELNPKKDGRIYTIVAP